MSHLNEPETARSLLALSVRVARIDERLVARADAEEARDELLRATIREAIREGLQPLSQRVEATERDIARVKSWAAMGAVLVTAGAWLFEHFKAILPVMFVGMTGCAAVQLPLPRESPESTVGRPRWCGEERPVYVAISNDVAREDQLAILGAVDWWRSKGVDYLQPMVVPANEMHPDEAIPRVIQVVVADLPSDVLGQAAIARIDPSCIGAAVMTVSGGRLQTAAHELGHALGLDHSRDPTNLLYYAADPSVSGPWGLSPGQLAHVR